MRYAGPACVHLDQADLECIVRALLADNTPQGVELRARIRTHLDARDFARNVNTHAEARAWIPLSHRPHA